MAAAVELRDERAAGEAEVAAAAGERAERAGTAAEGAGAAGAGAKARASRTVASTSVLKRACAVVSFSISSGSGLAGLDSLTAFM